MYDENGNIIFDDREETTPVEEVVESVAVKHEESEPEVEIKESEISEGPQPSYYVPPVEEHKEEKKAKKPNFFLRGIRFIGMAAVFGIVAGGAFYGINYAADSYFGTNVVTPVEQESTAASITVNKSSDTYTVSQLADTATVMDVSQIVEKNMPSAVSITGTTTVSYGFSPFFGGNSSYESPVSGSGVIIGQNDTELLIVTNAHVVDDVNNLTVTFIDGSEADAVIKGSKSSRDIAVIAVKLSDLDSDTLNAISIVEIGDSEDLKMGQPVIAIGNALGEGQSSNVGWISALNRTITIDSVEYPDLIMTDAAINPGNSGGALLNMQGQLIGITSAKYSDESVEGMGYAIPISSVEDIINELMNREIRDKVDESEMGYLGISGISLTSDLSREYGWPEGILVNVVSEDSPAENAGLLKNDVIYSFDGEEVSSMEALRELMSYYRSGETVTVSVYRLENGEFNEMDIEITLGSRSKGK